MALALQKLFEPIRLQETFTVTVFAVMTERITVQESLLQRAKRAVFFKLSGRVPRRWGGLNPGRGG